MEESGDKGVPYTAACAGETDGEIGVQAGSTHRLWVPGAVWGGWQRARRWRAEISPRPPGRFGADTGT